MSPASLTYVYDLVTKSKLGSEVSVCCCYLPGCFDNYRYICTFFIAPNGATYILLLIDFRIL